MIPLTDNRSSLPLRQWTCLCPVMTFWHHGGSVLYASIFAVDFVNEFLQLLYPRHKCISEP